MKDGKGRREGVRNRREGWGVKRQKRRNNVRMEKGIEGGQRE